MYCATNVVMQTVYPKIIVGRQSVTEVYCELAYAADSGKMIFTALCSNLCSVDSIQDILVAAVALELTSSQATVWNQSIICFTGSMQCDQSLSHLTKSIHQIRSILRLVEWLYL